MAFELEKNKISNNSMWKDIDAINKAYAQYGFNSIKDDTVIYYEKRTSKAKYGHVYLQGTWVVGGKFDFIAFLTGKIFEEMPIYQELIDKYLSIFQTYEEYEEKILKVFESKRLYKDISTAPQDNRGWFAKTFGTSTQDMFRELQKYEDELLDKRTFNPQFPTVVLNLSAMTQYDTYSRDITYKFGDIVKCYNLALEKKGKMTFVQQQRAIVSDDMRYNVLKRDGFRCRICGATANDGVKLEVDHIIPVSKGGKSTYDNLQTLCERCNRGKRNK